MPDDLLREALALGDDAGIRAVLEDVCRLTDMGFSAVARVTEDRWIACQVLDRVEFGLAPGDELEIATTICNDIRQSGQAVVIDDVAAHPDWRRHPVPILYGFQSYASFPIILPDGSFFGTLCAIDPRPRATSISSVDVVKALEDCAARVAAMLTGRGG